MKKLMNLSVITAFVLSIISTVGTDDAFSCYGNVAFLNLPKENQRGAILPRTDVILEIGGKPKTVLCRFNDAAIEASNVFFRGIDNTVLTHEVVNSSTIQVEIGHSKATKYNLQCVLRRPNGQKVLCKQVVKAGYPPRDIVKDSFHCVSKNYEKLNCTWKYENNPITTKYIPQYSVPSFSHEASCVTNDAKSECYWEKLRFTHLRDKFYLHIHGSNIFGKREFTRQINIQEVVIPDKISVAVVLDGPKSVRIQWNLSDPINVFLGGLWHKVDYRLAGEETWDTVKLFKHKHLLSEISGQRKFHTVKQLPLANMKYEFRVRLHTMAAPIEDDLWSDYDTISIYTKALIPSTPPLTDLSSFEVVEYLDSRDIYVNFQSVDPKLYSGKNFTYEVSAYSSHKNLDIKPADTSGAYVKYTLLDFDEIRFKIRPKNEIGIGTVFSEVIVPKYSCMPKKTDFFTVIIRNQNYYDPVSKVFSLYWVPSKKAEEPCPGGSPNIDYYTIFWCKNIYENRCKEKLFWTNVTNPPVSHTFRAISGKNSSLYEKNITGLAESSYTFGIAAISGNYSSGIRWSRCIVYESDKPPAPFNVNAYSEGSNGVRLTWELKCPSYSAVPLGFNISYCKSEIADFGHCTSKMESVNITIPDAKNYTLHKGLQADVSYIFSVSLLSKIGEGMQSSPVMFKIKEKIPTGPPKSFRLEDVGNSSAVLYWLRPAKNLRNGYISKFCIYNSDVYMLNNCINATEDETQMYKLENLSPFKKYTIKIAACTKRGCGDDFKSAVTFKTTSDVPKPVKNFVLDVSNWRLEWDWDDSMCNSRKCIFNIRIPVNDTLTINQVVEDDHHLSLYNVELSCSKQDMNFSIMPIGISEENVQLYGTPALAYKSANECPPVAPPLWLIAAIVSIGVIIAAFVLLVLKFGWRSVMKAIKACTLKIDVPKGILEDTIKVQKNEHKRDRKYLNAKHDSLLRAPQKPVPVIPKEVVSPDDKQWARSPRSSVSSEEIQLIPSNGVDRHGRTVSGSSDRTSSNQDSAVMSQSSSTGEPDSPLAQNGLPQRIPDFTYVQHGILPHKIPEGYVAAQSVPSLPHLLKSEDMDGLQSTPNLNSTSDIVMEMGGARRASTGYISMVNSDTGNISPSQMEPVVFTPNSSSISPYTKHGVFLNNDNKPSTPTYVTLMQAPVMFSKNGYVPPEAYCKVAGRESPPNEEITSTNPYVAVGDPAFMFGMPEIIPAYVQLADANRWIQPAPEKNPNPGKAPAVKDLINQMTPSLSKQSSGYVSQEALVQENRIDPVVMSPKRLVVHANGPQSVIFPLSSQQSSMV